MASHAAVVSLETEQAAEILRLRSRTVAAALADGMSEDETCVMVTHLGIVMQRAVDWAKLFPRVHAHYGTCLRGPRQTAFSFSKFSVSTVIHFLS